MLVPHLLHIKVEKKNKKKLDYIQLISKYLDLEKGGNEKWGVFMTLFVDVACTPGIAGLSELGGLGNR